MKFFQQALLLLSASFAFADDTVCNTASATCQYATASEAQEALLSSYDDLEKYLDKLVPQFEKSQELGKVPDGIEFKVGPLIDNGNGGILDIDGALGDVCDEHTPANCNICENDSATVRDAMICSVQKDPWGFEGRGNLNHDLIGFSNSGRAILAAQIGNPNASHRIMLMSQLHGSEAAATEAFRVELKRLVKGDNNDLLQNANLLFVLRANPDGGEPTANNWEEDYLTTFAPGFQYTDDAYFWRRNVDPSAGLGFAAPGVPILGDPSPLNTEPNFFGVVGRGYDLNRYGYADFSAAIRPVETQALIAAGYAFQPTVVYDGHGDGQKSACVPDPETIVFSPSGLPTVKCAGTDEIPTVLTDRASMIELSLGPGDSADGRGIGSYMYQELQDKFIGSVHRFGQLQVGTGSFTDAATVDMGIAKVTGATSFLVEVPNFAPPFRVALFALTNGTALPESFGTDLHLIEPCFLEDNICIHETALETFFTAFLDVVVDGQGEDNFCDIPSNFNLIGSQPASLGWPSPVAVEEPAMVLGSPGPIPSIFFGGCPVE